MKNISKVAIVGSSFEGHDTIKRIFGNFKVGKENVVVLVPHILTGNIYSYLKGKKKRIYPIYDGQTIESGNIYIGVENSKKPSESYDGLRKELKIVGNKFVLGKAKIDYINSAFCAVAKEFKKKSIGVILYGIGGDGVNGMIKIKKNKGKSIVEDVNHIKDWTKKISMPYNTIKNCEVDYILTAEKLGKKLEEMLE